MDNLIQSSRLLLPQCCDYYLISNHVPTLKACVFLVDFCKEKKTWNDSVERQYVYYKIKWQMKGGGNDNKIKWVLDCFSIVVAIFRYISLFFVNKMWEILTRNFDNNIFREDRTNATPRLIRHTSIDARCEIWILNTQCPIGI